MSNEKVTKIKQSLIIGTKQTLKAMKNGEVSEVYVAMDADKHITQKVVSLAERLEVPYKYVNSKKELGISCGIDVGASTAAVRK
ncbi:50S ribosomal protein L7ae-like protein [Oceanobacillus piezotolerans]|uniref:50S ribosomal protein L7ae-like protein n=1 Tax=Oceanobacillus piezotolerans TaxID=2448030 RepID=A0A498D1Q8_9BACI|nr:ribosomal L7Ae/L30e/S12e/Gadd45 family protein [Oceanobacillus piezotolerans]RLL40760.1 50S ribosomal protein L7ae-like protein [Oceanobacillus piezotolerans]